MEPDILCWDERNWNALIYAIYRQKCILLLGPDSSLESIGSGQKLEEVVEDSRPYTEILANELAKETGEDLSKWDIDINDLPQVAQYYLVNNSPMELAERVIAFYAEKEEKTSQIHKNLALLPFYLTITSTFDNLLFNALKELTEPKKNPTVDFYNFKGPKRDYLEMGTVNSPLIYQLYGSLQDPDSLIVTENDFLELLVRAVSGQAPIPENILSELTDEDKCLLFLGFGFRHWYLRVLLHILKVGSKRNPSFALERIEPKSIEEIRKATLFIKYKRSKIQICGAKLSNFTADLVSKYNEKYGGKEPQQIKETPAELLEKPTVFISYVRENKDYVQKLQENLKNNNIDARIDCDFLEPGDNWSGKIDQLILKEFDYFLLALSNDLLHQPESYAYKEMKLARERQEISRPGIKFLIPVKIDDCDIPSFISDIHVETIDLHQHATVEKIVKTIKRDFQLRKR